MTLFPGAVLVRSTAYDFFADATIFTKLKLSQSMTGEVVIVSLTTPLIFAILAYLIVRAESCTPGGIG